MPENKVRYIDYSPDEFIAGVSGKMKPEIIGVYWMICTLIYSKGKPIDNDPVWLGNIMGGTHWRTIKKSLDHLIDTGKVDASNGQLWVQRCSKELARAEHRISIATANGKLGGRPSKEIKDLDEPGGLSDENLTTNYQPPTTNPQLPIDLDKPKPKKKIIDYSQEFLEWWVLYPKQSDKPKAFDEYKSIIKNELISHFDLIEKTKSYTAHCKSTDTFFKGAWRWLRDSRYLDEYENIKAPVSTGSLDEATQRVVAQRIKDGTAIL